MGEKINVNGAEIITLILIIPNSVKLKMSQEVTILFFRLKIGLP